MGSSYIARLRSSLRQQRRALHLPLPYILLGRPGLRLSGVLRLLNEQHGAPAYLVLHCGANDIGRLQAHKWHHTLRHLVFALTDKYPGTTLIFSEMLPRTSWRYADPAISEYHRKRYQRRARALFGGRTIQHVSALGFIAPDGVHLTEAGQASFQAEIENYLSQLILGHA